MVVKPVDFYMVYETKPKRGLGNKKVQAFSSHYFIVIFIKVEGEW